MIVPPSVCGAGAPLNKATFLSPWNAQAPFGGFYVAKEKGYSSGRMGMLEASDYRTVAGELKRPGLIERMQDFQSFFIGCEKRAEK